MNKKVLYIIIALAVAYAIYYFMTYSYNNKNGDNIICFGRNAYKIKTTTTLTPQQQEGVVNIWAGTPKEFKQGECVFAKKVNGMLLTYEGNYNVTNIV